MVLMATTRGGLSADKPVEQETSHLLREEPIAKFMLKKPQGVECE